MEDRQHSFSVNEAIKYGVEKAILLNNIRFWLEKNRANKKNIYKAKNGNSYFWTYNSTEAFSLLFPYMKERSISRWLNELEDSGEIITGCFNKSKWNKTKWYTMAVYSISQNGESTSQNGESSITDDKTHIVNSCDSHESRESTAYFSKTTSGYEEHNAPEKKVKTQEEIEMNKNITLVIEKFKAVSPHLTYGNKTERAAAQKMISEFGASETFIIIDTALATMARDKYCPKATTPNIFYKKFGDIRIYFSSINSTKSIIV